MQVRAPKSFTGFSGLRISHFNSPPWGAFGTAPPVSVGPPVETECENQIEVRNHTCSQRPLLRNVQLNKRKSTPEIQHEGRRQSSSATWNCAVPVPAAVVDEPPPVLCSTEPRRRSDRFLWNRLLSTWVPRAYGTGVECGGEVEMQTKIHAALGPSAYCTSLPPKR